MEFKTKPFGLSHLLFLTLFMSGALVRVNLVSHYRQSSFQIIFLCVFLSYSVTPLTLASSADWFYPQPTLACVGPTTGSEGHPGLNRNQWEAMGCQPINISAFSMFKALKKSVLWVTVEYSEGFLGPLLFQMLARVVLKSEDDYLWRGRDSNCILIKLVFQCIPGSEVF